MSFLFEVIASAAMIHSLAWKDWKPSCDCISDALRYVDSHLREKGYPLHVVSGEIESKCWELCQRYYKTTLNKEDTRKLWLISNRLIDENSYPPVIRQREVNWFMEKMFTTIGKMWQCGEVFKTEGATFQNLVSIIEDTVLHETSQDKMQKSMITLYTSIVTEVMKSGWVYKRTRKQANWTTWVHRWCILTPNKIAYFKEENASSKSAETKGELLITRHTKLLALNDYNGLIHKLKGRFMVSNEPVIDMEIAVGSAEEKVSWLSALDESIKCCREKTTPIQKLLNERRSLGVKQEHDQIQKGDKAPSSTPKIIISGESGKHVQTDDGEDKKEMSENLIYANAEKLKAVFMKMDKDGNGLIDIEEFAAFLQSIGLQLSKQETNMIYKSVDKDGNGRISFDEFQLYFSKHVMDETCSAECVNAMRTAFMEADRDGSGTLSFREFTEYIWDKKRSIRMSKVMKVFSEATKSGSEEVSFTDFQQVVQKEAANLMMPIIQEAINEGETSDVFRDQLKHAYDDTEAKELASYIRGRWNKFATFRRAGVTGSVVMKGGHGMVADFLPGEYSLVDLACFSDLPPLVPKHTVIKGVKWVSSSVPGKSGKAIFPEDFDGKIETDLATNELLRYYGCSFADTQQEKVSLLYRHGIQDFTYENGYLEKYVTTANGGAGIEKHEFSHLDCPLIANSGTFVLGKFTDDDEMHITGFKIPVRHTLYIPGGTLHSNDYLSGTWRTMLSDETDIDHVHLTRALSTENDGKYDQFQFQFV
ncbi:CML16-like protein [Mya arenaria]|uniref:CML16-like protein n=1 Tax=Mya arenaria TaxID=6604 RepID=A0ABY7FMJ7_MYAAR|nr:CML16-like protein [Mya arenaria]